MGSLNPPVSLSHLLLTVIEKAVRVSLFVVVVAVVSINIKHELLLFTV